MTEQIGNGEQKKINILMLSIVYKGIAIPLYWDLLDKRGNSNTDERISLLEKFINNFGVDKIEYYFAITTSCELKKVSQTFS